MLQASTATIAIQNWSLWAEKEARHQNEKPMVWREQMCSSCFLMLYLNEETYLFPKHLHLFFKCVGVHLWIILQTFKLFYYLDSVWHNRLRLCAANVMYQLNTIEHKTEEFLLKVGGLLVKWIISISCTAPLVMWTSNHSSVIMADFPP